jgi:hypothetical protein
MDREAIDFAVTDLTFGKVPYLMRDRGLPFILSTGRSEVEIPSSLRSAPRLPKPMSDAQR